MHTVKFNNRNAVGQEREFHLHAMLSLSTLNNGKLMKTKQSKINCLLLLNKSYNTLSK